MKFSNKIKELFKSVKDGYFNEKWVCNACKEENFNGDYFCKRCQEKLPKIKEDFCHHCGRKTAFPTLYCDSCIEKNINFDTARSIYEYAEPIDKLLLKFKYEGDKYIANIFIDDLANIFYQNFADTDVITFVPMHEERIKTREYNQSQIIADKLSKEIKIEVVNALFKSKETARQATLTATERRENLSGSFKANKKLIKDKVVLLIDDVLTTGTTADVCAERLLKSGAKKVYVLTVASVSYLRK